MKNEIKQFGANVTTPEQLEQYNQVLGQIIKPSNEQTALLGYSIKVEIPLAPNGAPQSINNL